MLAKLSNKGLLGIALVLSFATAALVYNLLSSTTQKPPPTVGETVVVAKTDIPPKTRITQDMVQEIQLPSEYVQKAAMRELSQVLGVMTREAIVGGEQVLARRLLIEGKQAGYTGVIPPGKRALTVAPSASSMCQQLVSEFQTAPATSVSRDMSFKRSKRSAKPSR